MGYANLALKKEKRKWRRRFSSKWRNNCNNNKNFTVSHSIWEHHNKKLHHKYVLSTVKHQYANYHIVLTNLSTRIRVTQTKLSLFQHAVAQKFYVVGEMITNSTNDFAHSFIRTARNWQVFLNGSSQLRINHTKRELTVLLTLGKIVIQEILKCKSCSKI